MANTKTNDNGRAQRKSLGDEIERLHDILDGLNEALEGVITNAVKDAVVGVVGQAVRTAVREVLGNPDLLRAALLAHEPTQSQAAEPMPRRKLVHQVVVEACGSVREQVGERLAEFGQLMGAVGTYCAVLLIYAGDWFFGGIGAFGGLCRAACNRMTVWAGRLWRFRRTCVIAGAVGLGCGVVGYVAGPVIAAAMCAVGGAALTVSALILVPLARLLMSGCGAEA